MESLGADRKFMRSHSRAHSREFSLNSQPDATGFGAFLEREHRVHPQFYEPTKSIHSIVADNNTFLNPRRLHPSSSIISNRSMRSKVSDVSFSTNAGDIYFKELEELEPDIAN